MNILISEILNHLLLVILKALFPKALFIKKSLACKGGSQAKGICKHIGSADYNIGANCAIEMRARLPSAVRFSLAVRCPMSCRLLVLVCACTAADDVADLTKMDAAGLLEDLKQVMRELKSRAHDLRTQALKLDIGEASEVQRLYQASEALVDELKTMKIEIPRSRAKYGEDDLALRCTCAALVCFWLFYEKFLATEGGDWRIKWTCRGAGGVGVGAIMGSFVPDESPRTFFGN